MVVFFCKQKTAYEMRISDWSSDVCSSDLVHFVAQAGDGADQDALQLDVAVHERPLTMTAADFSPLTAAAPLTIPLQLPANTPRADLRLGFASSLLGQIGRALGRAWGCQVG